MNNTQIEKQGKLKAADKLALKEFIDLQKNYLHILLARIYKGQEIDELMRQYDAATNPDESKRKDVRVKWYGIPMPVKVLAIEIEMLKFKYKELVSDEKYQLQALKNKGMNKSDIDKLRSTMVLMNELPKKVKNEKV